MQDRYRRGGARYQYLLAVRRAVPDFAAAVIHSQNPVPGGVNVRRGGAAYLEVVLHHVGGVTAPVAITAEGLPKGLHAAPTHIHTDTRGTVVLWADSDAPPFVGPVRLVAKGGSDSQPVVREVRPYTRVDSAQASSRPTRELVVSVLPESSPFSLAFEKDRVEVEAGKKVDLRVKCDCLGPDFKGPVTVIELARPGPIQHGPVTVPEGRADATLTLTIQPGARPGPYTFAVLGQGQVPVAKEVGKPKANTLVSIPSRPVTVVVTAPKAGE